MIEEILEFINRRFKVDSDWTNGNCYYFAVILKDRFDGDIYYDPINGHFCTRIGERFFDYNGEYFPSIYERWDNYPDELQKQRLINTCLK